MDELVIKFNRKMKVRKTITIVILVSLILSLLFCLVIFPVMLSKGNDLMILFGVLVILLPILWVIVFLASMAKDDRLINNLGRDLVAAKCSADEIMEYGNKLKINLFDVALDLRCKELGITSYVNLLTY